MKAIGILCISLPLIAMQNSNKLRATISIGNLLRAEHETKLRTFARDEEPKLDEIVAYNKMDLWWYGMVSEIEGDSLYLVITKSHDRTCRGQIFAKFQLRKIAE